MQILLDSFVEHFSQQQTPEQIVLTEITIQFQHADAFDLANHIKIYVTRHQKLIALVQFLRFILTFRAEVVLWEMLGNLYFRLADWPAAEAAYQQALTKNDQAFGAIFGLAQALQKQEKFAMAKPYLERLRREVPDQEIILFQLACCELQLDHLDSAESSFKELLTNSPYDVETLVNLGTCAVKRKDWQQAIYYLTTALRVDDLHLIAHSNLANCLLEANRNLEAVNQYQRYLELAPQDMDAWFQLGCAQIKSQQFRAAQEAFQTVLQVEPQSLATLHNLAFLALNQNETSVAIAYYQRILALDPTAEGAIYMIAALTNKTDIPAMAPASYVKNLFNRYADYFDQHLCERLAYRTPQLFKSLWLEYQQSQGLATHIGSLLDLGCGTGLVAQQFKECVDHLVGVDLSANMLAMAQQKQLYRELHETDIVSYLCQVSRPFDLVTLADVLVYLGDLEVLFTHLAKMLAPKSQVLLSIEVSDKQDYRLTTNARYQHHPDYVLRLTLQQGFKHLASQDINLRYEADQPVKGYILLCERL